MTVSTSGSDEDVVRERTRTGTGRILIAVYAVFSLAAAARSFVQIVDRFHVAPIAFILSAVAAAFYILATFALARASSVSRRLATWSCIIEFVGVVTVGTISFVVPEWFPEPTVWSHFGQGYLFIPLVLPIVGLWWLRHTAR
ncbi:hypothetical protein [Hoyosella subflava]|uniref:Putative integral membrane protein n=1 Tax=Hoyosella subflava (strain DSM 45089 / JCM 17490 / NBRC 109087 / DQS3-9A1) TaxID=443218 RepID=F6EMG5_HOYSD|nr:hypothetical protein [Hoyosella subflava]AEF40325.1 Putative integral membrane protein [Hoyosella subflava DQS3-9A1]